MADGKSQGSASISECTAILHCRGDKMASNLNSPTEVEVRARISFHEALSAVEYFATKYPGERLCLSQAERLESAAGSIRRALAAREEEMQRRCYQFMADRCCA